STSPQTACTRTVRPACSKPNPRRKRRGAMPRANAAGSVNPEQYSRARRQPLHLSSERFLLAGVRRDAPQIPAFLRQLHAELKRVPQVLIHDQEIRAAARVLEFSDEKASGHRRAYVPLGHLDTPDQLARRKRFALFRNVGIMKDARA